MKHVEIWSPMQYYWRWDLMGSICVMGYYLKKCLEVENGSFSKNGFAASGISLFLLLSLHPFSIRWWVRMTLFHISVSILKCSASRIMKNNCFYKLHIILISVRVRKADKYNVKLNFRVPPYHVLCSITFGY